MKHEFTKNALIQIVNEWKRLATASPEDFEGYEPDDYDLESADYFLEIVQDILQ